MVFVVFLFPQMLRQYEIEYEDDDEEEEDINAAENAPAVTSRVQNA